jgi:hypothetical protein
MNKKILIALLMAFSLKAEYSTRIACDMAMRILGAGLIEHVESSRSAFFNLRTADGQFWNLIDTLTTEEESEIRRLAECFRLDENNLHLVIAFLEQIIPAFEKNEYDVIDLFPSSTRVNNTRFYTEILPIIKEHNEAALIVLKEFAFNFKPGNGFGVSEKERFKFNAVTLDILIYERRFSYLATAFFFEAYGIIHRAFCEEIRSLDDNADLGTLETAIKAVTLKAHQNAQQKLDFDPTLTPLGHARYDVSADIWFPVDDFIS